MPTNGEREMIREAVQYLPKGYCIVPVIPTDDMLQAAVEVGPAHTSRRNLGEQIKAEYQAAVMAFK